MNADILAVLRGYPQIYFACHSEHRRARSNAQALSARDASVLAHLSVDAPLRAAALARHLGIRPSTLSAALAELQALGYIARDPEPADRRVQRIRLTARGEQAMAAASVLDADRVALLLARLSPAERRRAVEGLDLLAGAARALGGVTTMEENPAC